MQTMMQKMKRAKPQKEWHCPFGGKHSWAPAYTFLNEAQQFEIGAVPDGLVCKKCLGQLSDYLMFWVVEK